MGHLTKADRDAATTQARPYGSKEPASPEAVAEHLKIIESSKPETGLGITEAPICRVIKTRDGGRLSIYAGWTPFHRQIYADVTLWNAKTEIQWQVNGRDVDFIVRVFEMAAAELADADAEYPTHRARTTSHHWSLADANAWGLGE